MKRAYFGLKMPILGSSEKMLSAPENAHEWERVKESGTQDGWKRLKRAKIEPLHAKIGPKWGVNP